MSHYSLTTTFGGETYSVSADWAQASSPVDGVDGGRQVADFRHRPELALRQSIEESIRYSGDDPDDMADEIDAAIEAAEITDPPEYPTAKEVEEEYLRQRAEHDRVWNRTW